MKRITQLIYHLRRLTRRDFCGVVVIQWDPDALEFVVPELKTIDADLQLESRPERRFTDPERALEDVEGFLKAAGLEGAAVIINDTEYRQRKEHYEQ